MKLKALIAEKEREIEIKGDGSDSVVFIDGIKSDLEVSRIDADTLLMKTSKGVFEAYVSKGSAENSFDVFVGTDPIAVEVFDPKRLQGAGAGAGLAEGAAEIRSAMPGKIVKVMVAEGDEIESGDGVVVVEAMKMQNELKSPKDGVVKQILVAEEDRVNSGDVLVVIE